MDKKKKIKIIGILLSFILIIAIFYGTLIYLRVGMSQMGGGSISAGDSISINCENRYIKAFLLLNVNTSGCKEKIKYYIKSPDNKILDQGEIEKNDTIRLEKKYPGYKGIWKIEFENLSEGEALNYELSFKAMYSGDKDKWSIKHNVDAE